jgi:hypothetical protein
MLKIGKENVTAFSLFAGNQCLNGLVFLNHLADLTLIRGSVLFEQVVGIGLRGRLWVGIIEEILNAEQDLLDGDSGSPVFLFIED